METGHRRPSIDLFIAQNNDNTAGQNHGMMRRSSIISNTLDIRRRSIIHNDSRTIGLGLNSKFGSSNDMNVFQQTPHEMSLLD